MWEKMKRSKFAAKLKSAKSSRTVYITVITLLLALAILITATAISNRAKKRVELPEDPGSDTPKSDTPGGNSGTDKTGTNTPSSDQDNGEKPSVKPEDGTGKQGTIEDKGSKKDSETVALPELNLPVAGIVAKGYDSAIQVYSATMGDYRIHLGIDMTTTEDAPVFAAADGVVSRIWTDPLMGKCLAISHSGDCYTIYKNLAENLSEKIEVGSPVTMGQQIGLVGDTATVELAEEPHLHLEMTVKGLSVDPMEYFSAQALAALSTDTSYETPVIENK